jgi:hypothetical protein
MDCLVQVLEANITETLPERSGLAFDGWSENGVHYLAVFAVGPGIPGGKVLLGFSPFDSEDDLSAEEHKFYIETLLDYYHKTMDNVAYFVGDNCATNQKLARICDTPMIGCNSHKLNLAVMRWLGTYVDADNIHQLDADQLKRRRLLEKLSKLMSKLKTIKGKALLARFTDYVALKANETRWNGNYRMVRRFITFKDELNLLISEGGPIAREVAALMPTGIDILDINEIDVALTQFQSVSLLLQKADGEINLDDVRVFFDKLIDDYGDHMTHHLAADADIVCSPVFESAVIKLLNDQPLTATEARAARCLEQQAGEEAASVAEQEGVAENHEVAENHDDYALKLLSSSRKKRRITKKYIDVSLLPVSSNVVERFFSQVKLNLTNLRNNLLPSTLEILMFLKMNRHLWGPLQVQKAMNMPVPADE